MSTREELRRQLLAGIPAAERRLDLAGISTAVLEGGEGPPLVLLHGPGEFAGAWLPVLAQLVRSHRVIVPDLPGHGASAISGGTLDAERVLGWMGELIGHTCPRPPALVGRVVGGAIAARFALDHPEALTHLVLVDTTGLEPFDPDPRFGMALHRFYAEPTISSFERAMDFCAFDLDGGRRRMGQRWEPLARYVVELVGDPGVQAATSSLMTDFAATPIPPEQLAGLEVPAALIWGRYDLALPLRSAETAAALHGWPLYVIEDAGDDPPFDQPDAFLDALNAALGVPAPAAI